MIALLLALQSAPRTAPPPAPAPAGVGGSPLGAIPRQQLPVSGCAAYLWSVGDRHELIAMASAEPGRLRLSIDGRLVDLVRGEQRGGASFGFAPATRYASGDLAVSLDLTVVVDPGLTQGATIPGATLTLTRAGQDDVVLPTAGLIGCAGPIPDAPAR